MSDEASPTPGPRAMKKAGSRSQKSSGGGSSPGTLSRFLCPPPLSLSHGYGATTGGSSPQPVPANQRRRQSMLILDLQSKKKAILQQILDVRQELVLLDRREMAVIERATHVHASDGERKSGVDGLPSVRDLDLLRAPRRAQPSCEAVCFAVHATPLDTAPLE